MPRPLGIVVVLAAASFIGPAGAHRIDEYLQATFLAIEPDRIHASMDLVPGQTVADVVVTTIDTDADGAFSVTEQRAYAQRVLDDLSITIDGAHASPTLTTFTFPSIDRLRDGTGDIHLDYTIATPPGPGDRTLVLANQHLAKLSVYLVNVLAPRSRDLHIVTQQQDPSQSRFEVVYRRGSEAKPTGRPFADKDRAP